MSSDDHRKALQILDMGIANSTHLIELARLEGVGSQRCSAGAGSSTVIGAISMTVQTVIAMSPTG